MMSPYYRELRQQVGHALLICPSAFAALFNDRRDLLLVRKHGASLWGFPGGAIEPDETILSAVAREVAEEIRVEIIVERLLAVYSSPSFDLQYENGDAIHPVMFLFAAHISGGSVEVSEFVATDEIAEVGYFPAIALPAMRLCCQQKARVAFQPSPPHQIVDPSP
jgi:8-oxo-dGTP diphosphatase